MLGQVAATITLDTGSHLVPVLRPHAAAVAAMLGA